MLMVVGFSFGHMPLAAKNIEKYDYPIVVVNPTSMSIGDLGFRVVCALGGIFTLKATLALGTTSLIAGTGTVFFMASTLFEPLAIVPAVGCAGGCALTAVGAYYTGGWTCSLFRAAIERNHVVIINQRERDKNAKLLE
jgi:hypothetical protein